MSAHAPAVAGGIEEAAVHGSERGFARLELELNDYPGPLKTSLFGIQHVLVMFTAMIASPLVIGQLLNLTPEPGFISVCGRGRR